MIKRFSTLLILLSVLVLVGCDGETVTPEETKTDIEIVYEVKNELAFENFEITDNISIPTTLNEEVTITWTSSASQYLDVDGTVTRPTLFEGNQNVSLTATIRLNEAVAVASFNLTVISEEKDCRTCYTDITTMNFSYDNTDFMDDGIGEVDLVRCVDGDTAIFSENGSSFTVRFFGINTPESTYKLDPWGKAASDFTCDKLTNADSIVLEYDPSSTRTDNYERYLAWIWYDGRLLNLELIEESYTGSKGLGGLKYESVLYNAELLTQGDNLRIWGEVDPNFDYSEEGQETTIENLVIHQENVLGVKFDVQGVITRMDGYSVYIQDGDYGIYVYNKDYISSFEVGAEILLEGVNITYYPDSETGAVQITGVSRLNYKIISTDNVITPVVMTIDELSRDSIGSFVQMDDLTVKTVYVNQAGTTVTVTAEDVDGDTIKVYYSISDDLPNDYFTVGAEFSIVSPLSRYNDYQLVLLQSEDVTFTENN